MYDLLVACAECHHKLFVIKPPVIVESRSTGNAIDRPTVLHNAVIIAQFLKRHGRGGILRELQLPERSTSLPREYTDADLTKFFAVCSDDEGALFSTFLMTGLREQEVMYLFWTDLRLDLHTARVTAKRA
jgi:hypothetical protein